MSDVPCIIYITIKIIISIVLKIILLVFLIKRLIYIRHMKNDYRIIRNVKIHIIWLVFYFLIVFSYLIISKINYLHKYNYCPVTIKYEYIFSIFNIITIIFLFFLKYYETKKNTLKSKKLFLVYYYSILFLRFILILFFAIKNIIYTKNGIIPIIESSLIIIVIIIIIIIQYKEKVPEIYLRENNLITSLNKNFLINKNYTKNICLNFNFCDHIIKIELKKDYQKIKINNIFRLFFNFIIDCNNIKDINENKSLEEWYFFFKTINGKYINLKINDHLNVLKNLNKFNESNILIIIENIIQIMNENVSNNLHLVKDILVFFNLNKYLNFDLSSENKVQTFIYQLYCNEFLKNNKLTDFYHYFNIQVDYENYLMISLNERIKLKVNIKFLNNTNVVVFKKLLDIERLVLDMEKFYKINTGFIDIIKKLYKNSIKKFELKDKIFIIEFILNKLANQKYFQNKILINFLNIDNFYLVKWNNFIYFEIYNDLYFNINFLNYKKVKIGNEKPFTNFIIQIVVKERMNDKLILNYKIERRYKNFDTLHQILENKYKIENFPKLPSKFKIQLNKNKNEYRLVKLNYYLNEILKLNNIWDDLDFQFFMDFNYKKNNSTFKVSYDSCSNNKILLNEFFKND